MTQLYYKTSTGYRNLVLDTVYPVGSIYMSIDSTSPSTLFGGTWARITGQFLLAATDNGSSGASQAAGNTGGEATHTLTPSETAIKSHSHTVPAHAHGLNSHKHKYDKANSSVTGGSHSHSLGSNSFAMIQLGGDYIKYRETKRTAASQIWTANWSQPTGSGGATSSGSEYSCDLGGVTANSTHSHTLAYTSTDSGAASGNTANSTAVSTTGNPTDANGSAHNNMPPYVAVYVWKRTA